MLPLEKMLDISLLIKDKTTYGTANIFGFIAYTDQNPYVVKVLQDDVFWKSLHSRTEGWILYAIKPDSSYYGGGNAEHINNSLGLTPKDFPQLIILSIGSDQVMMQRNYPIIGKSEIEIYNSIEQIIDTITAAVKRIEPRYKNSTNVHREVVKAVDSELASGQWKKVATAFAKFAFFVWQSLPMKV